MTVIVREVKYIYVLLRVLFSATNLIYLTIMLICCVLTTIVLQINENTIQTPLLIIVIIVITEQVLL